MEKTTEKIENKKQKKIIILILAVAVICLGALALYIWNSDKEDEGFTYNADGTVTLGEGFTANSFYSTEGQMVDSGDYIVCENGHVKGQVSFQQNHKGTTEYGLILMLDFIQKEFVVEDETYQMYRFSLTGEDKIRIDIDIDAEDEAHQMEYIIIMEPDLRDFSLEDEDGWNNFWVTKNVYSDSFFISNESGSKEKKYEMIDTNELPELDFDGNVGFQLIKSEQEISVFDSAEGMGEALLCIGGTEKKTKNFAAVAFCDWKQVPIAEGELVRYYSCVPERNSYEKIIFPDVQEEALYQIFFFDTSSEGFIIPVQPTFRVKLERRNAE